MIRVEELGKRFPSHSSDTWAGDTWVFRNLSFSLEEGKSLALIGPSGGGKSVLLKVIAGLLSADEGHVRVSTTNLGMLFQKNALFDSLTVRENLLFPLKERQGVVGAEAERRASRFLQAVGLSGSEDLYPDEISGGMQKRLGIARALVVEPELILYDEPTAGLDPITSRSIADLIIELRRETGSTVLTVTNDVQRALQLGDRIALLAKGRLLQGGSPEEVRATRDPALRQFISGLREGPLTEGE